MFLHQLLTCQYNLFHWQFAQEHHPYQRQPRQLPQHEGQVSASKEFACHKNYAKKKKKKKLTDRAAEGSDNIAIVYLHFLTTAAGVSPIEAPCSTSSLHYN